MRIEMCGPPTAGKSVLVKELKSRGINRGPVMPPEQIPKKWQSFADFIKKTYAETTYKSLPNKTLSALASAWMGDNFRAPMVFDELVILCGISMAIRLPKEYSDKYFSKTPLPSILVYLTADTKTLMLRNNLRKERNRSEKTLRAIAACNEYIPVLQKRGCNVLTFNTATISTSLIADSVMENIYAKHK